MVVRAANRIAGRRGAAIGAGHSRRGRGVNHDGAAAVTVLEGFALALAVYAAIMAAIWVPRLWAVLHAFRHRP
jgi:hypothetical protein